MSVFMLGLAFMLGASGPVASSSAPPAPATSVSSTATLEADSAPLPTPQFQRYGVSDELPSTGVYAVAQAPDGAMWFGTKSGIARFDGVHFKTFRHIENNPDSLFNNNISTLIVDRLGSIWAGGLDAGLNYYDVSTGKFVHWGHSASDPRSLASDRVWVVAQTTDGVIWVGTGSGLDRLQADKRGFEHIVNPLLGQLPEHFGLVRALYVDPKGRLWIGSDHGVFRRETSGLFTRIKPLDPSQSMYPWRINGDGDEVRLATDRQLLIVGADNVARPFKSNVIPDTNVMTSTRDAAGRLWIGTQRGMYLQLRANGPVTAVVDQPLLFGDLPGSWIWQTLVDSEGGLWVTTIDGGVGYLAPGWSSFSRFTHIPEDPNSLRDSMAETMARGRDGRHVWVGERKGRIDRLDPVTGAVEHILSGLNGDGDVLGMTEDFDQHLWIAVQGALYRYDYVHGRLEQIDPTGQYLKHPLEVELGPDKEVYARTFGQGLYRIDSKTLAVTPVAMDKPNDKVMWGSQLMLYKGVFWYGSDGGLLRLNAATHRFEVVPGAPTNESVDAFDFDRTGMWIATANGLFHYHAQGRNLVLDRSVDAAHGWPPSLEAVDIDVDCLQRVWIFGHNGLWRFNPEKGTFHQLGLQNGLANNEFTRGYALFLKSGYLYAPTTGGVAGFDPDKVDPKPATPMLSVTQITVSNDKGVERSLPLDGQPLRVGWRDHQLHIEARLFSYIDPWRNQYQFRLNGFDPDWVNRDNHGERDFTGLASGSYTLDIKAHGAEGSWVQMSVPLRIEVQSPPWLRWWAWLLYAVLIAAIACMVLFAWRRRLAQKHQMQLAKQRHQIAEQASAAKSQFLATLSHEIRTPMTGVMGMAELLLGTPLNDTQREYAEAMQRASNVLLKLLNDALDMARIEAGKLVFEAEPFNPRSLVQDVVRLQRGAAQAKGLMLGDQIDDNVPTSLIGDALRIRQVLFNLLNNAVKFTEHGGVAIHVSWYSGNLTLEVSDSGPGISETSHVRLFRRFVQDDGPQRSVGTGLGLAICNELTSLMGGSLTLESALGHGSTFHIRLPLEVAPEEAQTQLERPRGWGTQTLDVLLVESDPTAAIAIGGMLEHQGQRVRYANNGLNALAELAQERCDAILLDLDLPGIDGFQVAQLIRQGEVAAEHVPIIAMTTRTRAEEVTRGHQVGIDGFLRKPLTSVQLSMELAAALAVRSTRSETRTA